MKKKNNYKAPVIEVLIINTPALMCGSAGHHHGGHKPHPWDDCGKPYPWHKHNTEDNENEELNGIL